MTMPMLMPVADLSNLVSPFGKCAKRIELVGHPDGVIIDVVMADESPQTFRVVSVTPASHVTVGLKMPVVEVKPPWISNAR